MSTPTAPPPSLAVMSQLEDLELLDAPGKQIGKLVRSAISPGTLKDLLSGTWLGHALHPLLTDVVIGSFTSANVLDLVGGRDSDEAAERLIAVGLLTYPLTAATGVTDWADTEPASDGVRRVGLIHAATNGVAASLYFASLRARRRGDHRAGVLLGLAGSGLLMAGGYLGGHMSYAQGVGVDQTRFDQGPTDWTPVTDVGELPEGELRSGLAGETPVLLVRRHGVVHALHDRCSHRGCSLAGGTLDANVVECPCHGSRFSVDDGLIVRGPATTPQPVFDVREQAGTVEVRLRA